ncbi:MAG: hypothetical protein WC197_08100, partial [Candidatus Gastranaerophilaceae bacterium]
MNVYSNKIITNIVNSPMTRKAVSCLSSPSALLPIMLLDDCVIAGRTYQAYKRGGLTEARERLIDEVTTSVVWLFGIGILNKVFDKLIQKKGILGMDYDVGKDAISDPFRHGLSKITKGMTKEQKLITERNLSALKFGKIILATVTAITLCGVVLPKINQKITKLLNNKKQEPDNLSNQIPVNYKQSSKINMQDFIKSLKPQSVSFQNSSVLSGFLRTASHNLENNPIVSLFTVDIGLGGGRAINARNKDERFEIIFREAVSSVFYLFAGKKIYDILVNHIDKFKGITDLDPTVTNYLDKKI